MRRSTPCSAPRRNNPGLPNWQLFPEPSCGMPAITIIGACGESGQTRGCSWPRRTESAFAICRSRRIAMSAFTVKPVYVGTPSARWKLLVANAVAPPGLEHAVQERPSDSAFSAFPFLTASGAGPDGVFLRDPLHAKADAICARACQERHFTSSPPPLSLLVNLYVSRCTLEPHPRLRLAWCALLLVPLVYIGVCVGYCQGWW
jgi:hypothetical protein